MRPNSLAPAFACQQGVKGAKKREQGKDQKPENVVICGGGIQGAAIAYYLSLRGVPSTIVEQCEVACAASGKAGGFLAKNWGAGLTRQLHEVSFDLHEELARNLRLQGYRKLPTVSVSPGPRRTRLNGDVNTAAVPRWLDRDIAAASLLDDPGLARRSMRKWDTAQTSPKELTQSLLSSAAKTVGLRVMTGKAEGVVVDENRSGEQVVTGLIVDGTVLETGSLVIAMGPWSCVAEDWFPHLNIPMQGIASTSMVFRSQAPVDACAVFCKEDDRGCSLEIYPRPNTQASGEHEVYVSGLGGSRVLDNQQLKQTCPQDIQADLARVAAAHESFRELSSVGDQGPHFTQACMRPCSPDGLPYIGRVRGTSNVCLAAGHNCWGNNPQDRAFEPSPGPRCPSLRLSRAASVGCAVLLPSAQVQVLTACAWPPAAFHLP